MICLVLTQNILETRQKHLRFLCFCSVNATDRPRLVFYRFIHMFICQSEYLLCFYCTPKTFCHYFVPRAWNQNCNLWSPPDVRVSSLLNTFRPDYVWRAFIFDLCGKFLHKRQHFLPQSVISVFDGLSEVCTTAVPLKSFQGSNF